MANSRLIVHSTRWFSSWLAPFRALGPASRRMSLALFLWGVGEGLWLYVRPLYVTELGGTPRQAGLVLAAAGLAPVLLMLPAGRLIDRFGSRKVIVAGWWIGTAATVSLALARGWEWLVPGFFMYAVSASAIPAVNAYIALDASQQAGGRDVARTMQSAISTVYAAYFAGTIVSPMVGGWLGERFGLRVVFWVSLGWFLLSTLTVLSTPVLLRAAIRTEAAHDGRALTWWQFSAAQFRIFGALLALFVVMALGYALVPNYLEDVRQMQIGAIGGLGAATALGGVVWMLVLGGRQSRNALAIAAGLMVLAFGVLLAGPHGAAQFPAMMLVYFLLGAFLTVRTLSLGVVSEHAPLEHRGTSFGMVETVFGIGAFLGPGLAGELYGRSATLPFLVALCILIPMMVVIWLTLRSPGVRRQ